MIDKEVDTVNLEENVLGNLLEAPRDTFDIPFDEKFLKPNIEEPVEDMVGYRCVIM